MLRRKSPQIHRSSVSAETVSDNEDLLRQILLRLPVRSLLKFKSVSKQWCSLISSRSFSHHHGSISHPLTPSGIFLCREFHYPPVFDFVSLSTNPSRVPLESLDFTGPELKIKILQSCNGLLLCSTTKYTKIDSYNYNRTTNYYIHNPSTKQFAKIPYPDEGAVFCMNLAFDPSLSSHYEVVCLQKFDCNTDTDTKRYKIKIYSSETGEWRRCNAVLKVRTTMAFRVYWKRAIYWLNNFNEVFYFDLCEETVHKMPMPLVSGWEWDKRRVEQFGNCCGHLYLIEIYYLELDVWEMQDDRSGWFLKYHLDFDTLYAAYPKLHSGDGDFAFGESFPLLSVLAMIDRSDHVDEEPYLVLHMHMLGGEDEDEDGDDTDRGEDEDEDDDDYSYEDENNDRDEDDEEKEEEVCVHKEDVPVHVDREEEEEEEVIRVNVKSGSFERLVWIKKAKAEESDTVDAYLYIESLACV